MDRHVIREAARWYAQLDSGEADERDHQAWSRWRLAHPDHAQAWGQIEALRGRLQQLPVGLSLTTLRLASPAPPALSRRAVLRGIAATGVGGGALWAATRGAPWAPWTADVRTAVGEQRDIYLADGSQLMLDTATAVDIEFDTVQRRLRLREGGVFVQTARDPAAVARPFLIETPHGQLRALGTRFGVRVEGDTTHLIVTAHAVGIAPLDTRARIVVTAGQQARFTTTTIGAVEAAGDADVAWTRGQLIVADRRLHEVIAELARYQTAPLRCDPAVAALRVSGAFPLRDTTLALAALTQSLPVRVVREPRWLGAPRMRVEARPAESSLSPLAGRGQG